MTYSALTDDELGAYAQWAEAERDAPLAALVAELQQRRAQDRLALLILVPEAARLGRLEHRRGGAPCVLELYDPAAVQELRALLEKHGLVV